MQQPINFLPASYRRQLRERHRNVRQGLLLLVLGGALGMWWLFQAHQTAGLRDYAQSLEQEVRAARRQMNEVVRLRNQHKQLRHQVRVQRLLATPLRHTEVLATLGAQMPKTVALTQMNVESERPAPETVFEQDGDSGNDDSSGDADEQSNEPEPHRLRIEMTAMAPDDMTVANLLTSLKQHPLFTEASMQFSRSIERYGVMARLFRLRVVVDLRREFDRVSTNSQPDDRGEGGMAHVD